jgi:hypothetical protein
LGHSKKWGLFCVKTYNRLVQYHASCCAPLRDIDVGALQQVADAPADADSHSRLSEYSRAVMPRVREIAARVDQFYAAEGLAYDAAENPFVRASTDGP